MEDDNNTASKLIIEKLRKCDDFHNRCDYLMEHDEITYLLDYITNLQQEKERLKELDENYPIEEELAEAYRREEDYKSRIEKAVEYIKTQLDDFDKFFKNSDKRWKPVISYDYLLNILDGRSDE